LKQLVILEDINNDVVVLKIYVYFFLVILT
jgi:hypothetical protein